MDRRQQLVDAIRKQKGMQPKPNAPLRLPEMEVAGRMPSRDPLDLAAIPAEPELNPGLPEDAIASVGNADPTDDAQDLNPHETKLASVPEQAAPVAPMVDTRDADELAAAQAHDRQSRNASRIEQAAKHFVSGVTQTPMAGMSQQAPSQVPQAMAAAKTRRELLERELMRKRQGGLDQMAADENKSQADLRRAQIEALILKKNGKGDPTEELASAKTIFAKRYPEHADLINGASSLKVLQDLQNSLDAQRGQDKGIEAAQIAASATRYEKNIDRGEDKAAADAKKIDDDAKALAADMKGRGVISKRLRDLEATIPASGDVPGTGIMGDALAWFDSKAGTDFQSPKAVIVRQNIGKLMAAILREQSGATVSEQEYARAVMNGLSTRNATTTRQALKDLQAEFAIGEKEIKTKYPKAAIETYEKRAGGQPTPAIPKPSPGPGYVRGAIDGKPGWINNAKGEWEPD
jgi:hypothetical protein